MAAVIRDSSGTVTRFILLTDIAGSSRLAEAYPEQYYAALEAHNCIIEHATAVQGGEILKHLGDGYLALFGDAASAINAAVAVQLALNAGQQGSIAIFADGSKFSVRAIVHGGRLTRLAGQDQDWFGPPLNRCARIGKVCHPGQLLISGVVRAALTALPPELAELDLGRVRLRDLGEPEQLIQLTHPRFAQRQFPPLLGLDSRPNNLALQPNAFIGRDKELAELWRLLAAETRLLTLHAHGGYGKSRLAAQLCAHLLWRYEHGAFEVLLAPVRDHNYLPQAIADATGFQFYGKREPREQILDFLRNKEMLLCLDNFEHLLEGAEFIAEILMAAPKVRILVTSREPLRLTAERVYCVEPLPLGPGSDAVQLFFDRATRVKHRFQLNGESVPLVERICERLEGIPLALELVAAWASEFTLPELLSEVEKQLEVTARMRDVPERQRSVRASCDWSYGLLRPELKRALRCLAVFRGGCFVDAAAAVLEQQGPELRQTLAALSDKSWVFAREVTWGTTGEAVGQIRHFLRDAASHEYAFQLLCAPENSAEHAQATAAHARYFSSLLELEGPKLYSQSQPQALGTIRLELLNIYQALDTLHTRLNARAFGSIPSPDVDVDSATMASTTSLLLPIARWLWEFLDMTGECRALLERYRGLKEAAGQVGSAQKLLLWSLIGCSKGRSRLSDFDAARAELGQARSIAFDLGDSYGIAQSLDSLGNIDYVQGNFSAARDQHAESLAIRRAVSDRPGIAYSLNGLGNVEYMQGDFSAARKLYAEASSIRREIGDRLGFAASLNNLGIVEFSEDNYSVARGLYAEALAIQREIGNRYGIATLLNNLANVERMQDNCRAARELYTEALAIQREIGNRYGIATSLHGLGLAAYKLGDYGAARAHFAEALSIQNAIGERSGIAYSLSGLGIVDYMHGEYSAAHELITESLTIMREIGDRHGTAASLNNLGAVEYMRNNCSDARALYTEGLAIQREIGDRHGIAASLTNLGAVEHLCGNHRAARELFAESLALKRELENSPGICDCLAATGFLLATAAELPTGALCIYGAQHRAALLNYAFEPMEGKPLRSGLAIIEHPGTGLPSDERERLKTQAEAMSIDELAQFALDELEKLKDILGTGQ